LTITSGFKRREGAGAEPLRVCCDSINLASPKQLSKYVPIPNRVRIYIERLFVMSNQNRFQPKTVFQAFGIHPKKMKIFMPEFLAYLMRIIYLIDIKLLIVPWGLRGFLVRYYNGIWGRISTPPNFFTQIDSADYKSAGYS